MIMKILLTSRANKLIFICSFLTLSFVGKCQMGVNSTGALPDASAVLDVSSTTKGFLTPRMTIAQRIAILSPATGLIIYQTDGDIGLYYFNGTIWKTLTGPAGFLPSGTSAGNTPYWNGTSWVVNSSNIYNNGSDIIIGANNAILFKNNGAILVTGDAVTGITPTNGAGSRLMWIPAKSAFRVGTVQGTEWDDVNIGSLSFASGLRTIASGSTSTAMGYLSKATNASATALGFNTTASGESSIAVGNNTLASGYSSTSMGLTTAATGGSSTAMGYTTTANGIVSTAMGQFTTASGTASLAAGSYSNASGSSSTALGASTASGFNSISMGSSTASGRYSTATGISTIANGEGATSMGMSTNAIGNLAFAFGFGTYANGPFSTAFGASTTANGISSTSMGFSTIANGIYSTSMGFSTTAQSLSSLVIGRYNVVGGNSEAWLSNDPLFVIGNGSADNARNNAVTVLKNGNVGIENSTPTAPLEIGINLPISGSRLKLNGYASSGGVNGGDANLEIGNGSNIYWKFKSTPLNTFEENALNTLDYYIGGNGVIMHNPFSVLGNTKTTALEVNSGIEQRWAGGLPYIDFSNDGAVDFDARLVLDSDDLISIKGANLTVEGNITCINLTQTSDARFKKNFSNIENSLSKILKMNGLTYFWKRDEFKERNFSKEKQIGFVAQEVEQFFPELVQTDAKGYKSVDYARLTPVLVEAIKIQQKQMEDLKTKVAEISELREEISSLKSLFWKKNGVYEVDKK
jgi:hypothetical protein